MSVLKKNTKILMVIFILLAFCLNLNSVHAASGSSSSQGNGNDETSLYKSGKQLVIRAKKLEKKNN